ncbi:hypothetical protein FHX41_1220 [Actinomadura hallensis]|uniref:Uncharacterized protein n=1 Tax=Actinomadura hallensis TaxID=337895 RepID=A0A543IAJ1_9ACTN|nr:hypothetical protein [Actinomadura hallensis]TQM67603.1 hypothetical protein FHX41_1220 [Actinomadura hallensis]
MLSLVVAQGDDNFPLNDDTVSPGFLGLGVVLLLGLVMVLLIRSMNKQVRKIQAPREAELIQQEWERAEAARAAKAAGAGRDAAEPAGSGPAGSGSGDSKAGDSRAGDPDRADDA